MIKKEKIYIDQLTNIQNRFALMEYLEDITHGNAFLINIDNFSNINNAYGFDLGDKVLIEISKLINIAKPISCKLFRINSDEFVLLNEINMSNRELEETASALVSFFDQMDIEICEDIEIRVSISIGIASGSSSEVLNEARVAIKELREYKRGSYKIFNPNSTFIKKQQENIYWIHKIKDAFAEENIIAFYQPIINNKTKKIEKFECLARINDKGVLISPIRFLEASKLTGTLTLLTRTIIQKSFEMFADTDYDFSINITSTDFHFNYLQEYLLNYSKRHNINPSRVILEILEDITTLETPGILEQLNSLREEGFRIAIDDFGSLSSNFSRLLEFSPDYLKIDGSFIKNILTDNKSLIIVEAIVLLCQKSGIKTVAEFVHSKDVQAKVEELGIDYSQGYYFSKPQAELVTL
ncbi:EAL domain-containing protein [Candidatus Sulfurimonas baltica]|uniref:GGDEF and EAL domain-containing protein n=1 Tax=Candidatus Sulfurimonas baltica TaxID=2740404 RepID=A0A7S7LTE6_9BACT|nr:GGDEF and EAL domain-containing protein [Candidatus Sulfurimonas baltica]QOY51212.1 GGDEF and EAL domain-containing protein [Candidatus Sulfurimonas baltica]